MTIELFGARQLEQIARAADQLLMVTGQVSARGIEIPAHMLSADGAQNVLATPAKRPTYIKPH